jgi:hypothetical protein
MLAAAPGSRVGQQGLRRSLERAELSDRLDEFLVSPAAMKLPAKRSEARQWVAQARLLEAGPVLRSQIARVELMMAQPDDPAPDQPSAGFSNR